MKPKHAVVESSVQPALNPYQSSQQPAEPLAASLISSKAMFRWRVYLGLHILVVVASGAWSYLDQTGGVVPLWGLEYLLILWAHASNVVAIVLVVLAVRRGGPYILAALVEIVLVAAHWFVLFSSVQ
ncbi:MAG: hypothetical protein SFU86_04775 [Pirellulaceae bacterium]|nr:hypothetical protein [Pirellulaceae bacterium]